MNTHAEKVPNNQSQSVAKTPTQQQGGGVAVQLIDNRPTAIAHRKLQQMISDSPRTSQLKAYRTQLATAEPHSNPLPDPVQMVVIDGVDRKPEATGTNEQVIKDCLEAILDAQDTSPSNPNSWISIINAINTIDTGIQ